MEYIDNTEMAVKFSLNRSTVQWREGLPSIPLSVGSPGQDSHLWQPPRTMTRQLEGATRKNNKNRGFPEISGVYLFSIAVAIKYLKCSGFKKHPLIISWFSRS